MAVVQGVFGCVGGCRDFGDGARMVLCCAEGAMGDAILTGRREGLTFQSLYRSTISMLVQRPTLLDAWLAATWCLQSLLVLSGGKTCYGWVLEGY